MRSVCLSLLIAAAAIPARAADPQPYNLSIAETGTADLDEAVAASSLLSSLQSEVAAPPFALVERARGDLERIKLALNSFGYYQPHIAISIAGHDVSDPGLPGILDHVAQGESVDVRVAIEHGPLYRLGRIDIDGALPPKDSGALGLAGGQPAVATDVLGAQARMLGALQESGYAFAKVDAPMAYLDDNTHTLAVTFKVQAGPRATIGPISFHGLKDVNESFVRGALSIHPGDLYRPSSIERARQELIAFGVFSGVSVRAADQALADGGVPLTFDVQERPRHAVALSANYSTDLGASVSANWSHRNLLGNAEQLLLSAAATGLGGSASSGIGYNVSVKFIQPRFLGIDQLLETDTGAVKQDLDAYDQKAESIAVFLRRKFSPGWTAGAGLSAAHDEVMQENSSRLYQLLSLPLSANYDNTGLKDPIADAKSGLRLSLTLTPTLALGSTDLVYVVAQGSGSVYFDLSGDGRSVLALRALAGSIQGGANLDLPPDQRFYAGGSATVRGFRYQSIGPHFADGNPVGATSVDAGTIEFRQRVWGDWGAAAFIDAGQASANSLPFQGAINAGVGLGLRYYTSIGAVRADVAVPLTHVPGSDSFELYIGLGQAF